MLQRVVVDQVMDWVAGLVEPADTVVPELMTAFRPLIVLLEKAYTELNAARENVFKAAGETAGQLLTGALLVRVDRNVLFVAGELPEEAKTEPRIQAVWRFLKDVVRERQGEWVK